MNNLNKIILIFILLIISGCSDKVIPSVETTKCIAENSVLYVSTGCIHCEKQKNIFGENYQYLNTTDCLLQQKECSEVVITSVPTWIINGTKLNGIQTIERLKEITNCK